MFESDATPAEQIERLESQIDEMQAAIRRSRKLVVVGWARAAAGAALLFRPFARSSQCNAGSDDRRNDHGDWRAGPDGE